ncbi:MAG TPA: FAD-binding protein [Mycobacteriales bacterium]|nr:FAD-binding protein [Mycobacteriales bacterium]
MPDVVVVGAGVAGQLCALRLSRTGAAVLTELRGGAA